MVALVNAGADCHCRTKAGPPNCTPLMLAVNLQHAHISAYLEQAEQGKP